MIQCALPQVLLIDVLASETTFGYGHGSGWRILTKFNGKEVKNLAHLYLMYHVICKSAMPEADAALRACAAAEEAYALAAQNHPAHQDNASVAALAAAAAEASAAEAAATAAAAAASIERDHAAQPETKKSEEKEKSKAEQFLVFEFENDSRIVLETIDCMLSEGDILAQHGIPTAASPGVHREAMKLSEAEAAVDQAATAGSTTEATTRSTTKVSTETSDASEKN